MTRRRAAFLGIALGLGMHPLAHAQGTSLELAVKAAYLTKFAPFITWERPIADAGAAFELCVAGADPFGSLLDEAARGQMVAGRPMVVRRMANVADAGSCRILYVGESPPRLDNTLAALRGQPVLTVTDVGPDSAAKGVINFVVVNRRVRFEVNAGLAAEDGLSISSKLLSLAVAVRRG